MSKQLQALLVVVERREIVEVYRRRCCIWSLFYQKTFKLSSTKRHVTQMWACCNPHGSCKSPSSSAINNTAHGRQAVSSPVNKPV